jgi:hypothetical protein
VELEFDLDRKWVLGWAAEKKWFFVCTLVPHDGALVCGRQNLISNLWCCWRSKRFGTHLQ